jgi:hypothetical protein
MGHIWESILSILLLTLVGPSMFLFRKFAFQPVVLAVV